MDSILFLKSLQECIISNKPVFSRDIGGKGEKSFFVCDYKYFCEKYYKNLRKKHIYEVIQFLKPTKLFLDFDCKKINKSKEFDLEIENVVKIIQNKIQFLYNQKIDFCILDSSNSEKLSKHIIFNIFFRTVNDIKNFVNDFLGDTVFLDKSIYTRNRSFRIIYSSKKGKETKLVPENSDKYNEQLVLDTLLQANPKNIIEYKSEVNINQSVHYKNIENIKSGIGDIISTKACKDFHHSIVRNVFCPFAQKIHKSNNTYMTKVNKSGLTWFKCSDPDCPKILYGFHFNFNLPSM